MKINYVIAGVVLIITGCVSDNPVNLVPSITDPIVSDISRTEATVSAKVSESGILTSFRFIYGIGASSMMATTEIKPDDECPETRLTGLRPGTEYTFACEGWNDKSSAIIRSSEGKFTTNPNVIPVISDLSVLSSGPVGLVAGFEIYDDGGEPLLSSGFIVSEINSMNETVRLLPESELSQGLKKFYIGGLNPGNEYRIIPFATNRVGRKEGNPLTFETQDCLILGSPGDLKKILGDIETDYDRLIISGVMNGDDFRYLRHILGATVPAGENMTIHTSSIADLSDVTILDGGVPYDESHFTEHNVIGTGMFGGCTRLKKIILPASAVKIKADAFTGSDNLESIEIPAAITEISPSNGCMSLNEITVSKANINFVASDGVLFNAARTELIWFPEGKNGTFTFPASVIKIGTNAFNGTKISRIELPPYLISLGEGAFSKSALESIVIPDGVMTIPQSLFQGSYSLTDVTIGRETELIGSYVFDSVPLLHLHVYAGIPPVVKSDSFSPHDREFFNRCELHVPQSSLSLYRNHAQWGKFSKISAE